MYYWSFSVLLEKISGCQNCVSVPGYIRWVYSVHDMQNFILIWCFCSWYTVHTNRGWSIICVVLEWEIIGNRPHSLLEFNLVVILFICIWLIPLKPQTVIWWWKKSCVTKGIFMLKILFTALQIQIHLLCCEFGLNTFPLWQAGRIILITYY